MSEHKSSHHIGKTEHAIRKILHILELIIAGLCLIAVFAALAMEVYKMFTESGYVTDLHHFLQNILTIVVGVEFVRMLIDLTPANTMEVLIMATARYIIMNHDDPVTLLIGIICVAGLFATRRFLIPKNELTEELVEID